MFKYPALYLSAGRKSASAQNTYFSLIAGEYILLFIAAILALNLSSQRIYFVAAAFVILCSLTVFAIRNWLKPEQDWYRARALAESIKTTSWRYCMRAEPFGGNDSDAVTRLEFASHLKAILDANKDLSVSPDEASSDQITACMEATRSLSLRKRKAFYEEHRVQEQRNWYVNKAKANKRASCRWIATGLIAYATAVLLALLRIANPEHVIWPIEPIIVVASSIVGWMQIRKFNELASSYTLTAHEIGIIKTRIGDINSDDSFAEFVNDAEQAFSREHTQWVARQQTQ